MKKYRSYIIIIFLLIVVAVYFLSKERQGTLKIPTHYFALTDTSEITSIRIIKNNDTLLLGLAGENWMVNQKYNARYKAIKVLMELFSTIEINAPVPKSVKTQVVNCFEQKSILVTFETKNRVHKEFEICESDSIGLASFIRKPGSNDIYIASIPGYSGKISILLPIKPDIWRENTVMRYKPWEILTIQLEYPQFPDKSFILDLSNPEKIEIKGLASKKTSYLKKEDVIRYLLSFNSVLFETIPGNIKTVFDSLQRSKPVCIITIKGIEGHNTIIRTFSIPSPEKKGEIDLFKMYAVLQNDSIPVYVKYVDFDPIMKSLNDFLAH